MMASDRASCRFAALLVLVSLVPFAADARDPRVKPSASMARSNSSRHEQTVRVEKLVTGDAEHLSDVVAGTGATLKFYFTPRPPLPGTEPSLAYPTGWAIDGQKLTVPRGGFSSAWITQIEGWDPDGSGQVLLRSFQDKIDATTFMGSNASPPNPGCDLTYPASASFACQKICLAGVNAGLACTTDSNCPASSCNDPCPAILGEPGPKCGATVAGFCDWGWQNTCGTKCESVFGFPVCNLECDPPRRADWVLAADAPADQFPAVNIVSLTGPIFGATTSPQTEIFDEGIRYYTGTLVLPIPPCAKGTYTIGHVLGSPGAQETFFQDQAQPANYTPVAALVTGVLEIPIGSCCTDFTVPSAGTCTEGVTVGECNALASTNLHIFRPNADCTTPCEVECVDDADCDDGLFCNGAETCVDTHCIPGQPPCGLGNVCNEDLKICTMEPVPTVSHWGLTIIALGLLIAAKIGSRMGEAGEMHPS